MKVCNITFYFSLFGALRYKNPLPWDTDVDILIRHEELQGMEETVFIDEFNKKNITIYYRPWFGAYRITRDKARGDLMIFKNNSNSMNRVGLESYAFFINYRNFHVFPARLIKKPLPQRVFCGVNFSVPRNGLEIQKYHYRQDWWLEKLPKGCPGATEASTRNPLV